MYICIGIEIHPDRNITTMQVTPRYIVVNPRTKEGFVITDAKEVANLIGMSFHTVYSWSSKGIFYIERNDFIIIKDPKIIKSKKGGLGFNKSI